MATPLYQEQIAEAGVRETEDIAARAEDRRALSESLIGTEEQVAGTLGGVSAELLPYTRRFALDPILAEQSAKLLPNYKKSKKKSFFKKLTDSFNPKNWLSPGGIIGGLVGGPWSMGAGSLIGDTISKGKTSQLDPNVWYGNRGGSEQMQEYLYAVQDDANALLQQAQDAAAGGDFETAEQLKNAADRFIAEALGSRSELGAMGAGWGSLYSLKEDPKTRVMSQLASPAAVTVGGLVKRGRELTDPNSVEYKRTLSELQDPIREGLTMEERNIAAATRGAERYAKGIGAQRGAARSLQSEAAAYHSYTREAARERADAISTASQALSAASTFLSTEFAPKFATQTAGLARSWAAGEAGTRDEYIASLGSLNAAISNFSMQLGSWYQEEKMLKMQLDAQKKMQKSANKAALAGAAIGAVSKIGGAVAGGMMCHAAAEYFGWHTPLWHSARAWIAEGWKGWKADLFRTFYSRYSLQLAWVIRNVPGMKALWRPFFMRAAKNGGAR